MISILKSLYLFKFKTFADAIIVFLDSKPEVLQALSQNLIFYPIKLHLDIHIESLKLIVPLLKSSKNALVFNVNNIEFKTSLEILNNYYTEDVSINQSKLSNRCRLPPILENHHLNVQSMVISRFGKL